MSAKTEKIKEVVKETLTLTQAEVDTVQDLLGGTNFPGEFISILSKENTIPESRKLVMMYHFAQGHMYSAVTSFMSESLPRMMNIGSEGGEES